MLIFDAANWYWKADDGRVFASARQVTVDKTDDGFAAFEATGSVPTRWPADASGAQTADTLQAVLTPYGLAVDLLHLQDVLSADIDRQAEAQRLLYITPGEAQMATYLLKRGQALSAVANQTADAAAIKTADQLAAAYPYMANEIGITVDPSTKAPATDIYGVARAVSAISVVWQTLDLAIEKMRLATKAAISAAATAAAAQAAHDAVAWPVAPTA